MSGTDLVDYALYLNVVSPSRVGQCAAETNVYINCPFQKSTSIIHFNHSTTSISTHISHMRTPIQQLTKSDLIELYVDLGLSASQIANMRDCSVHKVNYWLHTYGIQKRSISEAIYQLNNPEGDPFEEKRRKTFADTFLFGLGLGLYWGEGTRRSKYAVRLGNSDPNLIKVFLQFLKVIYRIEEEKLRFGLQLFSDTDSTDALKYWSSQLGVHTSQFMKVIVTPVRGKGTYRRKSKYGVLTVYFGNKKLRDMLCNEIEKLS